MALGAGGGALQPAGGVALAGGARGEAFLRLASALWQFWYQHGHLSEGSHWLEQALAQADGVSPVLRTGVLDKARTLVHYQGDDQRAGSLLEVGLRFPDGGHMGNTQLAADARDRGRGSGRYAEAVPFLAEARTLFEWKGYRAGAALALGHRAVVAYGQGDWARAGAVGAEALSVTRAIEDSRPAGLALWFLALTACEQGHYATAATCLTEALAAERFEIVTVWGTRGKRVWFGRSLEFRLDFVGPVPARRSSGPKDEGPSLSRRTSAALSRKQSPLCHCQDQLDSGAPHGPTFRYCLFLD